ncbi:glycosyltransferase family 4 protein [Vibrio breoganii]|uniref:Glycosyltransferase family 4 protein n=2 Tax=Vibrio breoganii TaxID=553239 RepID=A0ABX1U8U1_9VIBR|nr:glycosyltransferase family 4 protein [Vibrio breoganii]NMR70874.1 glycosyltransferase family 4 protein [Vibrio breoganii]
MSGARKRVTNLSQSLTNRGLSEVVICSPWDDAAGSEHVYFSLDCGFFVRIIRLVWLSLMLFKLKPDIVISESALCPVKLGRYKLYHVIHDTKFTTKYSRKNSSLTYFSHYISCRMADRVLTVSNTEKSVICERLHMLDSKVAVSYNGLSSEWFAFPEVKIDRAYDILYVSNFAKHKGHLALLDALSASGNNFKVAFVGGDLGTLSEVQAKAENSSLEVDFYSALKEDELIRLYDSSKLFVFPSMLEGFGMPFVEARSRGLPVIANKLDVFLELSNIMGGTIIDTENGDLLRATIESVENEVEPSKSIARFKWDNIANEILDLDLNER